MLCCGEVDAYWADFDQVAGDKYVAIITDERPNEPLRRKPIPVGTKFVIPLEKMNRDPNPTGHGVVFIRPWDDGVLCFIAPGGGLAVRLVRRLIVYFFGAAPLGRSIDEMPGVPWVWSPQASRQATNPVVVKSENECVGVG